MSTPNRIRIMMVDDHPVFREGLSMIIETQEDMELVAHASNAEEALREFRVHKPDITLMDQRMPGENGTAALRMIRDIFPKARIIMLTTSGGDIEIQKALKEGAIGYVLKNTPRAELLNAIRSVHAGLRHIPANVARTIAEHLGTEDLSAREIEVLLLIRDGHRNKQIADRLNIAESTVNFHIMNVVEKLQANDRTHAVIIALRRGLIQVQ